MGEVPRPQICRDQALRPRRRRKRGPGARGGDQIWRLSRASREIDIGMAHRGRLNVLANVMGKPYRAIFHEFAGGATNPADVGGSGDVKYHLGTSSDREFDGIKVHLALLPNPSHLEAVDPVVLGKARGGPDHPRRQARQEGAADAAPRRRRVRRAGRGVGMPRASPACPATAPAAPSTSSSTTRSASPPARSSRAPRPIRRTSPRASRRRSSTSTATIPKRSPGAARLATEFRQEFGRDMVIDMWCYRRFGHNEGDEPSFTQPLMYEAIRKQPPISEIYGEQADRAKASSTRPGSTADQRLCRSARGRVRGGRPPIKPGKADWFGGRWAGLGRPDEAVDRAPQHRDRARPRSECASSAQLLTTVPTVSTIHKTLQRILDAKKAMFESGEGFDWATAEALAFGSLVEDGYGVRLSGQDSGRGTFSHRHAVWVDQATGEKYIPLRQINDGQPTPRFEVRDSPLSRIRRARLRIWLFARRPEDARAVGSAVRRLRQWRADHHRPVHPVERGQVAARERARHAAPARHGRARGPSTARPGSSAICSCAPTTISRSSIAPRRPIISICCGGRCCAVSASRWCMMTPKSLLRHKLAVSSARRLHRRQPFPAHPERSRTRRRRATRGGWCCARASSPTS